MRQFFSGCVGLFCGLLVSSTVTLLARGVDTVPLPTGNVALGQIQACAQMSLDVPASFGIVGSSFDVAGWAIDEAVPSNAGVDAVHVWAYPNPGSGQSPVFLGVASYGGSRADVGAVFGSPYTNSGFFLPHVSLSPGMYRIAVYAHSAATGTCNDVRTADVVVAGPRMSIDVPSSGASRFGPFVVAGWALDRSAPSGPGVDANNIWAFPVGGGPPIFAGSGGYGSPRSDVGTLYGSQFANSGYNTLVALPTGDFDLVVYAHSPITSNFNQSRSVRVTVGSPLTAAPAVSDH
jgi:hypothetical protein